MDCGFGNGQKGPSSSCSRFLLAGWTGASRAAVAVVFGTFVPLGSARRRGDGAATAAGALFDPLVRFFDLHRALLSIQSLPLIIRHPPFSICALAIGVLAVRTVAPPSIRTSGCRLHPLFGGTPPLSGRERRNLTSGINPFKVEAVSVKGLTPCLPSTNRTSVIRRTFLASDDAVFKDHELSLYPYQCPLDVGLLVQIEGFDFFA